MGKQRKASTNPQVPESKAPTLSVEPESVEENESPELNNIEEPVSNDAEKPEVRNIENLKDSTG